MGRPIGNKTVTPLYNLWKMLYWDNSESFMTVAARSYRLFCQDSSLSNRWDFNRDAANGAISHRIADSSIAAGIGSSSPTEAVDSNKGSKEKFSGTGGHAGPNDDVMGNDFKSTNAPEIASFGAMPPPKPRNS